MTRANKNYYFEERQERLLIAVF